MATLSNHIHGYEWREDKCILIIKHTDLDCKVGGGGNSQKLNLKIASDEVEAELQKYYSKMLLDLSVILIAFDLTT